MGMFGAIHQPKSLILESETNSRQHVGAASLHLLAVAAVPDADSLPLHGILAAERARVLGVLRDLNLLDDLTQRGTVTGAVLAGDPDLLRAALQPKITVEPNDEVPQASTAIPWDKHERGTKLKKSRQLKGPACDCGCCQTEELVRWRHACRTPVQPQRPRLATSAAPRQPPMLHISMQAVVAQSRRLSTAFPESACARRDLDTGAPGSARSAAQSPPGRQPRSQYSAWAAKTTDCAHGNPH